MTQLGEGISIPVVIVDEPEEKQEEKKHVNIRFSLFFDGTLNNRTNTDERLKNSDIYKKHQDEGSYENDHTNIAKMERHIKDAKDYDITLWSYIDGPGTMDNEDDEFWGYAMGTGKSGVREKVEKGIKDVVNKLLQKLDKNDIVDKLTIDVFGFSRGAAGARNFIHEALFGDECEPIRAQLQEKKFSVLKVEIGFAGLYDTVSSHGYFYYNDVSDLKLNSLSHATKAIQLAAADEHRKNFSLTNINSAKDGQQFFLPGVHSDVGGSYIDNSSEDLVIYDGFESDAEAEKARLKTAGWYTESEIEQFNYEPMDDDFAVNSSILSVKRNGIRNQYSRIPLHVMAKFSRENGIGIKPKLEAAESIPGALATAKSKIDSYVSKKTNSVAEDWHHNEAWLTKLRHDYFHFSAYQSFANAPRFSGGKRQRKYYNG